MSKSIKFKPEDSYIAPSCANSRKTITKLVNVRREARKAKRQSWIEQSAKEE